jgi:hypothetical protein
MEKYLNSPDAPLPAIREQCNVAEFLKSKKMNQENQELNTIGMELPRQKKERLCSLFSMPKYKCIKEVRALKIERIILDSDLARLENRETDGSAILFPENTYCSVAVSADYVRKHNPQPGGYYVVYPDGYKSFSPAKAFEEGYILA